MIFIVDDDEATRDSLRLLLECEGLQARAFGSCAELLERHWPAATDCLVLDIHMPGLGGLDLLEKLRRAGNMVPAIVITGRPSPANRARAASLGALALLEKPYGAEELLHCLGQARDPHARPQRTPCSQCG